MQSVSVVIPAYNAGGFLMETVDSVLAQTYGPLEVIVVDDGSVDDTRGAISDYIEQGLVRYIRRENGGIAAARNTGLKACSGDYVAMLDHDDLWDKDKIEKQVEFIKRTGSDMVFTNSRRMGLDGAVVEPPPKRLEGPALFDDLLRENVIYTSTVLFKREILGRAGLLDEGFTYCEDWDWWLRMARGVNILRMPEYLVTRKDRPASFSLVYTGRYMSYVQLYKKHAASCTNRQKRLFRQSVGRKCYTDAAKLMKDGHAAEALKAFAQAVRLSGVLLLRLPKLLRLCYGG